MPEEESEMQKNTPVLKRLLYQMLKKLRETNLRCADGPRYQDTVYHHREDDTNAKD